MDQRVDYIYRVPVFKKLWEAFYSNFESDMSILPETRYIHNQGWQFNHVHYWFEFISYGANTPHVKYYIEGPNRHFYLINIKYVAVAVPWYDHERGGLVEKYKNMVGEVIMNTLGVEVRRLYAGLPIGDRTRYGARFTLETMNLLYEQLKVLNQFFITHDDAYEYNYGLTLSTSLRLVSDRRGEKRSIQHWSFLTKDKYGEVIKVPGFWKVIHRYNEGSLTGNVNPYWELIEKEIHDHDEMAITIQLQHMTRNPDIRSLVTQMIKGTPAKGNKASVCLHCQKPL